MTFEEMQKFFAENIHYKDWEFHIKEKNKVPFLQIQFMGKDNFSGKSERQYCRKWQLSEWMTTTELVRTAFAAVVQAEKHEAEETFLYKGQAVFNSHISADRMWELAVNPFAHEYRAVP
jgi:hypothetical protein